MKVLLAIDDCKMSEAAVAELKTRPWPATTAFLIISVLEPAYGDMAFGDPRDVSMLAQELVEKREAYVQSKVAELLKLNPAPNVSGKVLQGNVRDTIIKEATEWGADLLIMGSHGRKGLKRFLLGSVAESVLALAPCVVEIVKEPSAVAKRSAPLAEKETD